MVKNRNGVALLLVLWIIVILGVIASAVAVATRAHSNVAANYRAAVTGRYAAESGITQAVALIEQQLAVLADSTTRRAYLNRLDAALGDAASFSLSDAQGAVALVDPGARLDLNLTDVPSLTRLFSYFTDGIQAENIARVIHARTPLASLDQLESVPGLDPSILERAAPFLTVDGDGTINRMVASDTVLAAAGGELRAEPTRILIVSRGWRQASRVTHEIQAVYAIQGNELALVRWRERVL